MTLVCDTDFLYSSAALQGFTMAKKELRTLTVVSSNTLTPHMQRIVLTGEELVTFPHDSESGYIKFLFSQQGDIVSSKEQLEMLAPDKPLMRTYTVRKFEPATKKLTVDFVLHKDSEGPASKWAQIAAEGDEVVIVGPGPIKLVDNRADWFLFAGDMTALPAISCNLEQLPPEAKGYAVIEISSELDIQPISVPAGVEIKWVISDSHSDQEKFLDTVFALQWLDGQPYVWCACEFGAMKQLRKHFKFSRHIDKRSIYISSYWKRGNSEDQHKIAKQKDATQEESVN